MKQIAKLQHRRVVLNYLGSKSYIVGGQSTKSRTDPMKFRLGLRPPTDIEEPLPSAAGDVPYVISSSIRNYVNINDYSDQENQDVGAEVRSHLLFDVSKRKLTVLMMGESPELRCGLGSARSLPYPE